MVRLPHPLEDERYYRLWRLPSDQLFHLLDEKVDFSEGRCLVFSDSHLSARAMEHYLKKHLNKSNVQVVESLPTYNTDLFFNSYMHVIAPNITHLTPIFCEEFLPSLSIRARYYDTADVVIYLQNSWFIRSVSDCLLRYDQYTTTSDSRFYHFGLYPVALSLGSFEPRIH